MDCHRCEHIRYDGCRYGRCSHVGHSDVRIEPGKDGKRPYNKMICPDFKLRRKCSNCKYWLRGRYFADGKTPATKGRCSLGILMSAEECPVWGAGSTSSRKRKAKKNENVRHRPRETSNDQQDGRR